MRRSTSPPGGGLRTVLLLVGLVVLLLVVYIWPRKKPLSPNQEARLFTSEMLDKGLFYIESSSPSSRTPRDTNHAEHGFRRVEGAKGMIFLHHVEYLVPSELQTENLKELKGLKRANKGLSALTPERGGISLGRGVYGTVELLTVDVGFPAGSGRDNLLKDLENVVSLSDSTREGGEEWGLSSSFLDRLEIEKSGDSDATYSVLSRTPTFHSILRRAEREILGTIDDGIADRSSKANSSRSTQNYILWSFAPRFLSFSGSTERFYREVLRIVADSKSQALILQDSGASQLKVFVFPVEWVPLLQLHGSLVFDPENAVADLLGYNLAALSTSEPGIDIHPFDLRRYIESSDEDKADKETANSQTVDLVPILRAWNQIQISDAYWGLHPHTVLKDWKHGLANASRYCQCKWENMRSNCFPILSQNAFGDNFMMELSRSCQLGKEMLSKYGPASVVSIPLELHPTFALGEFRDFRNPDACSNKFANIRKGLKYIGLVSYPRSGNTWVRNILERATSVVTGSVYHDTSLIQAGLLGEGKRDNTLMIKDHYPAFIGIDLFQPGQVNKVQGVVLMVRDPFSSISSFYHYTQTGGKHVVSVKQDDEKWRNFALEKAKEWGRWHRFWVQKAPKQWQFPILVLKYEDMVHEPTEVLHKILNFIGLPANEDKLRCAAIMPCKKERACRVRDKSNEKSPYTEELKAQMLKEFGEVMEELGYKA